MQGGVSYHKSVVPINFTEGGLVDLLDRQPPRIPYSSPMDYFEIFIKVLF